MSLLLNGDCLEEMKDIDDNSVDLIFCDLPYGQTNCKWDCKIDLELFWNQIMRIKKLNTPIFFTTTTKFGVELITSAPKKCFFRYDIVWVKSAAAGFLSAKKMPMRKHEMIYVFYEKLPFYDLSSHKHKFLRERKTEWCEKNGLYGEDKNIPKKEYKYEPALPTSIIKEQPKPKIIKDTKLGTNTYDTEKRKKPILRQSDQQQYEPALPTSIVNVLGSEKVKEEKTQISQKHEKDLYGATTGGTIGNVHGTNYNPPLPTSIINEKYTYKQDKEKDIYGTDIRKETRQGKDVGSAPIYDPPLPTSMLEIKSTRGNHSTEKPVALMEWILKYYSKEGDVVLDPTMGSGSTGVACKNMKRNFIGIEKDSSIFEVAVNRIEK